MKGALSTRKLKLAPLLLAVSLCALSACGSSGATDAASEMGGKGKAVGKGSGGGSSTGSTTPSPTPAPTPTPISTTGGPYDLSIGNGVDASGFADLPLRTGAHRFFVSSATGSDSNGCGAGQQPGTPLKSIAAAMACVQDGSGDQILLAERTTYGTGLPGFNGKSGFDPVHPMVIQSYDPNDPLNDTKYGRASGGNRPVVNTGATGQILSSGGGASPSSPKYIAIRALDFNPGDVPSAISFVPGAAGSGGNDYMLFENNIFRYTGLYVDEAMSSTKANHLVIRNNSFYGQWSATGHVQGLYYDNWASATIEDNVFWHNGWKIGASRNDTIANGGMVGDDFFRHPIYQQNGADGITRRNLIVDGGSDGGQFRGNSTITENVFIDNPTSISAGGGSDYNVHSPNGVNLEVSYNAIFGDADINSSNPRGIAIESSNGRSGSSAHHNLIARSRNVNGVNNYAFDTSALFNQSSYMSWDNNVVYQWTTPLQTTISGGNYPTQDFPTYTNNFWDALTSGTNMNNASKAFPNPYTAAELYAALGYTDKTSFMNHAVSYPEEHPARTVRALLFAGYGMN